MGVEVATGAQGTQIEADTADELAQAFRDDSNLEMDWLWLATRVESNWLRRYCLQRALLINPYSTLAKRGLARLRRQPGMPLEF
jgi:hypothetical protein